MNWDKIEQLLRVAEGSLKFGSKFRTIHDAAIKALEQHNVGTPEVPQEAQQPEQSEDNGKLKRRAIDG